MVEMSQGTSQYAVSTSLAVYRPLYADIGESEYVKDDTAFALALVRRGRNEASSVTSTPPRHPFHLEIVELGAAVERDIEKREKKKRKKEAA